jgi:hypothetical protein
VRVDAMDRKNELNESSKWGRHPEVWRVSKLGAS